jgi:hypothetical protein
MEAMIKILIVMTLVCLGASTSLALPQFSLLNGNRCSNCHVAPSGGGLRNDLGWYSNYDVGLIPRDSSIISWLYPSEESTVYFDGSLLLGTDIRIQSARSFQDPDAKRATFPMQATLYAAYRPIRAFTLEGQFNAAALRTAPNTDTRIQFPGQRMGAFSAIMQPSTSLPQVRIGFFRPSIGVRYDDHTMFPYNYVTSTSRQNIVAPDYAEWGSELTWESERWLTVNLGIFGSEGLSQVRLSDGINSFSAVQGNEATISARVVAWPRFLDNKLNTYVGGSLFVNNQFSMVSAFGGAGISDAVYLMFQLTQTSLENVMTSTTGMTEIGWQIIPPLIIYGRYEHGVTTQERAPSDVSISSTVIGAQIFVMPFVEFRPEYRIWDTALDGVSTRWAFQLHFFY